MRFNDIASNIIPLAMTQNELFSLYLILFHFIKNIFAWLFNADHQCRHFVLGAALEGATRFGWSHDRPAMKPTFHNRRIGG